MTIKCPKWADKLAPAKRKCHCKADLVLVKCTAKTKEGDDIFHDVCIESGWMPENCPRVHPEVVIRPLTHETASYVNTRARGKVKK